MVGEILWDCDVCWEKSRVTSMHDKRGTRNLKNTVGSLKSVEDIFHGSNQLRLTTAPERELLW